MLLSVQLVVLAVYAVLLSASLLTEHRQGGNALLRSRGAGTRQIVGLALIQGLVLTVPAALLAPWARRSRPGGIQRGRTACGDRPVHRPERDPDAYVAAAVAAGLCLVALTLPGVLASRSHAVPVTTGRADTTGIGRRFGIDIALLAIAGLGLWQLRLYGAPLTRSIQGTIGLDPLLVAAPAIGLLAGALFALRIIPLVAQLLERATNHGRGLGAVAGLPPARPPPPAVHARGTAVDFGHGDRRLRRSYTWTWTASQQDQATFQIGTDLRVQPGRQSGSRPLWGLDRAYAGLPGVTGLAPVERESASLPGRGAGTGPRIGRVRCPGSGPPPPGPVGRPRLRAAWHRWRRLGRRSTRCGSRVSRGRCASRSISRSGGGAIRVRREDEDVRLRAGRRARSPAGGAWTCPCWSAMRAACSTGSRGSADDGGRRPARDGRPPRAGGERRRGDVRLPAGPARDRAPDQDP